MWCPSKLSVRLLFLCFLVSWAVCGSLGCSDSVLRSKNESATSDRGSSAVLDMGVVGGDGPDTTADGSGDLAPRHDLSLPGDLPSGVDLSLPGDLPSGVDLSLQSDLQIQSDLSPVIDLPSGVDLPPVVDLPFVGDLPLQDDLPPAGNPNPEATCSIPVEAEPADSSSPTTVVGTGTPASCTGDAVINAVAAGGVITFNCGPAPMTITLNSPAKVVNDTGPEIVIDGGGLITLSGGGNTRILYMNTCDQNQKYTTPHCDNQDHPRLTVQNMTFIQGNSKSETQYTGGGAIWVRGGRFKLVNTRFFSNVCADTGPDVGGAAVRVFDQYNDLPVYVATSTFGGRADLGGVCSNGGGISSISVSWTIINSLFSHNRAIGHGGNPATPGTPGGGSGGAIYNDGDTMTLSLCGTRIEHNEVNAHGSAVFFVSNDKSGDVKIDSSVITSNIGGSWYPTYPQISNHPETPIVVTNSTIQ